MFKKIFAISILTLFVAQLVSAHSTSWDALMVLRPWQKVEVVQFDGKTMKGEFSAYDEESISLVKKGQIVTIPRENVLSVSLEGASKRKKHTLVGATIGAGIGLALGIFSNSSRGDGFQIVSAQTVTGSLLAVGAGAGALVGAAIPARSYGVIYQAPGEH